MSAPIHLTPIQRAALALLRQGPRSVWNFGSTTIHRLRAAGYITVVDSRVTITEAGRAAQ